MVYTALTISRYIIDYSDSMDIDISTLKLQALLYFIQCHFLSTKNEICFIDDIEAWTTGPVIPTVYKEYKKFGAGNIPRSYIQDKMHKDYIEPNDKALISEVTLKLSDYSAIELIDIIRKQAPYQNVYTKNCKNKITIDDIKEYFRE